MQENRSQLIAIVICILFAGLILSPKKPAWPEFVAKAQIEKGIDLAGGAELRYRALFKEGHKDQAGDLQKIQGVLENRFRSSRGALLEPRITPFGTDQIVLQMPGIDRDKLDDYKKLVTQIGKLELREVAAADIQAQYRSNQTIPAGYEPQVVKNESNLILVKIDPIITGDDIAIADAQPDMGRALGNGIAWCVHFELKELGAKKFDDVAGRLYAQTPRGQIAIIVDGKVDAAPAVEAAKFNGKGVIQGGYNEESARQLAIVLRSGSLPVEIGRLGDQGQHIVKEPESENFVGPSLGADSIQRGIWACAVALIGVGIFMILYYRAGGVIAIAGLLINLLFILALMALFKATLTLPGIAGLVLTIGMALDANILVLERIREEMQRGKTAIQAFEAGYHRAFSTIVDSNLTTLVAAIVMYYFGTGAIKGFAVTLSLGIITTLISVLWCCKIFQRTLVQNGTIKQWKMARLFQTPNVDFVKLAFPAVAVSLVLVVASVVVVAVRKDAQFGIDLKGGSMVHFAFSQDQEIDFVRRTVAGIRTPVDGGTVEKYPDAEIQSVAAAGEGLKSVSGIGQRQSREFQLRTVHSDFDGLKQDLQDAFQGRLSHVPFEDVKDLPPNDFEFDGRGVGAGLDLYFVDSKDFSIDKIRETVSGAIKKDLEADSQGDPYFTLTEVPNPPPGLRKARLVISKRDAAKIGDVKERVRTLGKTGQLPLSRDPFVASERVHPSVAAEMQHSAGWAMIWSWALMIVYVAFRFSRIAFGVAAVLALVHDAVIAIGFTSLAGWIVPRSWGLSFEMNMNTVAAVLTIIGFSINDTIVTFDRIRENLGLMKKESFKDIINASVNQTLSRTILTAFTVWVTCLVLYFFTMTSGGGIASFAFPLLMGVIVGSYSTIYIAAPILIWWFKGKRPEAA
jgi:SecD/SecF fusion protein